MTDWGEYRKEFYDCNTNESYNYNERDDEWNGLSTYYSYYDGQGSSESTYKSEDWYS